MAKHNRAAGISEDMMREWAEGTLEEWLPGYTTYVEEMGSQLRIRLVETNTYSTEVTRSTQTKLFRVLVTVVEVAP